MGNGVARSWVVGVAAAVLVSGCGGGEREAGGERPRVLATTTIVADLVRRVAEPDVEVMALMGAGVDPHLYEPSAGDIRRMARAGVIFYNGHHLEGKMAELFARVRERGRRTVAVAECIPAERLIAVPEAPTMRDPHVWFDVALWAEALPCVAAALAELVPEQAADFRARADSYAAELAALDTEVRERLAAIPPGRRVLVTAHDAFAYFGRAYDVEVRGLLGISTVAEAGASSVQQLADFLVTRGIPAVFVESSVPPRAIQALAEAAAARGHRVAIGGSLFSDSLGSPGTAAASYVGTVRANLETIVTALGGEAGAP